MFDDRKATGNPGRITCCGAQGESQQQFPDEAPRTFIDELKNGTRKYKTIASLGGQIAEAYRGRCVLELLQNAHDALADTPGGEAGLVTF